LVGGMVFARFELEGVLPLALPLNGKLLTHVSGCFGGN
jgi:hypothetical protein